MALAAVRDLRDHRALTTPEQIADYEVDLLSEFVLARASAGVSDGVIRKEVASLEQIREWYGRPLWEMQPADADAYFGRVLRDARPTTRTGKAGALNIFFGYLELRHKVAIHALTGHVVECPLDAMNRPRTSVEPLIRVPPSSAEMETLFAGWRDDILSARKYATAARNYAINRLIADIGLRINECKKLDVTDLRWDLGRFGKLHVRYGKGSHRRGPKQRMAPLINGADQNLTWYVTNVWGLFGDDYDRPGVPLFPTERKNADGTAKRISRDAPAKALAQAAERHLPAWKGKLTPHVLRHYAASQLYLSGMDLMAIQELLGHAWILTTLRYIHVHKDHVERAWLDGLERAADRWKGLTP